MKRRDSRRRRKKKIAASMKAQEPTMGKPILEDVVKDLYVLSKLKEGAEKEFLRRL